MVNRRYRRRCLTLSQLRAHILHHERRIVRLKKTIKKTEAAKKKIAKAKLMKKFSVGRR
jgi:hypothetical protein